ncbi:MAG TPA: hypothetical protein VHH09_06315 [Acidimicrobiales bacterium]|nr:hypothetical protein [Acidimicrobiales bacterium]
MQRTTRHRATAIAAAAALAATLLGLGLPSASATHVNVTSVRGSASGYWADNISLFGGPQPDTGPTPSVNLASNASNSPQPAVAPSGKVQYGPAVLFTSDLIAVTTSGSLGTSGSVRSRSSIRNINKSVIQSTITGSEIFTADSLSGIATAGEAGISGATTVTNGTVDTHSNYFNCTSVSTPCGGHTHGGSNPAGTVAVPSSPPPNYKVAGHVHLSDTSTDYFVIVFNEHITNPDGSITVNPVHEYYGATLDASGNIVRDAPYASGGSILQGDLYLGQVVAGIA